MSRAVVFGICGAALVLGIAGRRIHESRTAAELPFETKNQPQTAAPMCPWREPANDLNLFFPEATGYQVETRILSGLRLQLAQRLGRAPTGDENALRVYRVYRRETPVGAVLTRRVKGVNGAIEIVMGVNASQEVCGVRLQRLREPEEIAASLQNPQWLQAFEGKCDNASWQLGNGIPEVTEAARGSAVAIVDGVRSSLILLATSSGASGGPKHH
jgi:hypothetical protein